MQLCFEYVFVRVYIEDGGYRGFVMEVMVTL